MHDREWGDIFLFIISIVMPILLVTTLTVGLFSALKEEQKQNQKQDQKQEEIYRECVAHETDYAIYMDGIRQDPEMFKIEALDKEQYTFKLDDDSKMIAIIKKTGIERFFGNVKGGAEECTIK